MSKADPIDIVVPPSKSWTHRALVVGALANPGTRIVQPLWSEDTQWTYRALVRLGIRGRWGGKRLQIVAVQPAEREVSVFVGNSGTTARLLTAFSALHSRGLIQIDGTQRMRQRPMQPLIEALHCLGAKIQSANGFLPIKIASNPLRSGTVEIEGHYSSQFLSALMLIAARLPGETVIRLRTPLVSRGYAELTRWFLTSSGIAVHWEPSGGVVVHGKAEPLPARCWEIEADWSSAAFWIVGALIVGRTVRLRNLRQDSLQPDREIVLILQTAGNNLWWDKTDLIVMGDCQQGIECSLRHIPDLFPVLAIYAVCAQTPSRFFDFAHLRWKESDRVQIVLHNLQRLGVMVHWDRTTIQIQPVSEIRPAVIQTAGDHRIAMAFALLQFRSSSLLLDNSQCVVKSYPNYWQQWEQIAKEGELCTYPSRSC